MVYRVGCASAAANRAEKSNLTGGGHVLASGAHHPANLAAWLKARGTFAMTWRLAKFSKKHEPICGPYG
jgi:hypothetical protein